MNKIVKVDNLYKYYGKVCSVNGISFEVDRGNIFAILGPNGAGKSTTIDILCTFKKPDKGKVIIDDLILGKDNSSIKKKIGVVFQNGVLDDCLTVEDNLRIRGSLYGLNNKQLSESLDTIISLTGLSDIYKRCYGKLSGGQKRRCDIARALIHKPKILFLDEPTAGLDPEMRKEIWNTIRNLKEKSNMTAIFTTHYMEEAQNADKIIILNKGQIAANGSPAELKSRYCNDKLILSTKEHALIKKILDKNGIKHIINQNTIEINVSYTLKAIPILELCKGYYQSFEVIKGTMDDAYLMISGKDKYHD